MLSKLQEVVLRSDDESDSIDAKLNTMSTDLHTLINNTIQVNINYRFFIAEGGGVPKTFWRLWDQ